MRPPCQRRQWSGLAGRLPGPAARRGARAGCRDRARQRRAASRRARRAGPAAVHAGVNLPTALLVGAFCLLATVPAGWIRRSRGRRCTWRPCVARPVRAVTIAGAAALLVTAYRLARSGRWSWPSPGAPFLGLALVRRVRTQPGAAIARATSSCGPRRRHPGAGGALAAPIPIAAVAALAGGRASRPSHRAPGSHPGCWSSTWPAASGPGSPASCTTWWPTTSR